MSSNSNGKFKWRCVNTALKCNAKCITYGNNIGNSYEVTMNSTNENHNHAPDPTTFNNLEKRRKIKEKLVNSDEAPRKILSQFVNAIIDDEEIANSPSHDADRQMINRTKAKNRPQYPSAPIQLSDFICRIF